tara:strand:- start:185 stop:1513 length:1329 start_codon:yes stop_codon:yes gene_type:complete
VFESALNNLNELEANLSFPKPVPCGKVDRIAGLTVRVRGLSAEIGSVCKIHVNSGREPVPAEVIGFDSTGLMLMPLSETGGIKPGAPVRLSEKDHLFGISHHALGRVINSKGEAVDGLGPIIREKLIDLEHREVNPLDRGNISEILDTGVKAINGPLTFCKGQRIGLVAGSGVGKSVLMAMLAKNTLADVVVIGLIGERGREVQEFIHNTLGPTGLKKSVVVASPVDVSPVSRVRAAKVTHAVAEYFSDQGKDVLILFDSLTRVAHAQREVGLAVGEPPTTKGYPPSVFSFLPKLMERCGVRKNGKGSISAVYTVLAEVDDKNDPIVDIARATLDGQIMLSRDLADTAHYPAINLEGSISRVARDVVSDEHNDLALKLRRLWTTYNQNKDLVQVGAYQAGTNPELDEAIAKKEVLDNFLRQDQGDAYSFNESLDLLRQTLEA